MTFERLDPPVFLRRLLLGGALALGAAACSTVEIGSAFDASAFEKNVQRGSTTRTQVQAWLGTPTGKGISVDTAGERYEEWTYYHGQGQLPRMSDANFRILQIKFDSNGVVRGYSWSGKPQ
jgi:outer membrane protein assembly factor BamE (lipoprotein component of BamABCDE complex)